MYINSSKNQNKLLEVDDNFATLIETTTFDNVEQAKFQFSFKVSQVEALKQNAFSVRISVKKPSVVNEPNIVPSQQGSINFSNSRDVVDNILNHKIKILNLNKKKQLDVITTKVADISSKINNDLISVVKTDGDLSNLGLEKTKIVVQNKKEKELSGNFIEPLKSQTSNNVNQNLEDTSKNLRLRLLNSGLSPTDNSLFKNQSLSAYAGLSGTSTVKYKNTNSTANQLLDSYLFVDLTTDSADNLYETIVDQVFSDKVIINTPILLQDYLNLDPILNVSFELIKYVTNQSKKDIFVLDRIDKTFNLSKYFEMLTSDSSIVSGLAYNDNEVSISVKANNKSFEEKNVEIYQKVIDEDFKNSYKKISTQKLTNELQTFTFPFNGNSIYRMVVENSTEFSDVFLRAPTKPSAKVVTVPRLTEDGIRISAYINNINDVVGARLLYRDSSTRTTKFSSINQIFSFDDKDEASKVATFTLRDLVPYHTYEFATRLILKNGTEMTSNYSSFLEYVPFMAGINANIVGAIVSNNDVQFTVQTQLLPDQIGVLNELLTTVSAQYQQNLLLNRPAEFDKFLAFNIIRYNTSRGDVDNLGIIKNNDLFVDSARSQQVSAKPLIPGDTYRYVIYPLVRSPEEVINESVEVKDEETKKKYRLNPRKHRHPLTLIKGSVVTTRFLNSDPKNDMLYGSIGSSILFDATIDVELPKIENVFLGQLDQKRLILSWNVRGDLSLIDHFMIAKEIDGTRTIVGKSHCLNDTLNFIYHLTNHDLGNVRFVLIAVKQDYSSGENVTSNYVLIENIG